MRSRTEPVVGLPEIMPAIAAVHTQMAADRGVLMYVLLFFCRASKGIVGIVPIVLGIRWP